MAESRTLLRLILELENLIQLSSYHVDVCKKRIAAAKEVMNVPSSQLVNKNGPKELDDVPCDSRNAEANSCIQVGILEEEITKILQLAENVRDRAMAKQHRKSRAFSADACVTSNMKAPSSRKRLNSAGVKSDKKTPMKSDAKTVYQKDYSLVKSKSMPSLIGPSKGVGISKSKAPERKSYEDTKGSMQCRTVGISTRNDSPRRNKDFIKLNKLNLGQTKKEPLRNTRTGKEGSKLASRLFQSSKVNESFLGEELALRTQLPKNNDILMLLRDSHNFLTGSSRKAGKKEMNMKENFIKRCDSSVSGSSFGKELCGLLDVSISNCAWVFGKKEIITSNELCNVKDAMSELEEKLNKLKGKGCNEYVLKNLKTCPENHINENSENYSSLSETSKSNVSPFWHPYALSSVFQGVELPPFLYYNNVLDWISFQNVILELQEYFIQLKIMENILPFIAEFLASRDLVSNDMEDSEWNALLARTIKAAVILGDFTGNLTVPILASIKPSDESSTKT
ncbi:uncharacterized protein LOC124160873 [Ischnura elegans]|uniref:uncharacterized protein LOC124160873 n=1 Tax=Ischnura elegans TaxID=197161 RepID=UPI001ED8A70E|nr:uncharacterized protein LOC124160873 [Ischnura elegans]XP_046392947.1 uncharacterized protein LOC124160873 [Ischnura elegans]XP_046392957.1 uncharacterized protein LOC124160873 [Ischnura elegans]XP_046392965.1 uncharacterized protein LOC124160873 [Ischnura elegans]